MNKGRNKPNLCDTSCIHTVVVPLIRGVKVKVRLIYVKVNVNQCMWHTIHTYIIFDGQGRQSLYLWNIFGVQILGTFVAVAALLKSWIKDFAVESSIKLSGGLCLSRDRRTSLSWHWLTLWWRFYVPPLSLGMWLYAGLGHKEVASILNPPSDQDLNGEEGKINKEQRWHLRKRKLQSRGGGSSS